MKKRIPVGLCILLIFMFCIATFLITTTALKDSYKAELNTLIEKASFYDKLSDVYSRVENGFIKGTDESDMGDAFLGAYIKGLNDPFSAFLTKDEMTEYLSSNEGNMIGIGINATIDDETGGIYVARVMNGSPAQKAGLLKGDIILRAGDLMINNNFNDAVNVIKGHEGETVTLLVKRGTENLEFTIKREKFPNESVIYETLDHILLLPNLMAKPPKCLKKFLKKRKLTDVKNTSSTSATIRAEI